MAVICWRCAARIWSFGVTWGRHSRLQAAVPIPLFRRTRHHRLPEHPVAQWPIRPGAGQRGRDARASRERPEAVQRARGQADPGILLLRTARRRHGQVLTRCRIARRRRPRKSGFGTPCAVARTACAWRARHPLRRRHLQRRPGPAPDRHSPDVAADRVADPVVAADWPWVAPSRRGTTHLTIIDYVGNHRSFLIKPQALLGAPPDRRGTRTHSGSASSSTVSVATRLRGLTYDLAAIDILEQILRRTEGVLAVETAYDDLTDILGSRPTASRSSFTKASTRQFYGAGMDRGSSS